MDKLLSSLRGVSATKQSNLLIRLLRPLRGLAMTVGILLLSASSVYADHCPNREKHTDIGCIPEDPAGFTAKLYSVGLGFIGGVAVLSIIYGAYLVLSSQGDPDKLNKGKSYIVYAIIGLILAVGGYAFYTIIGKDVLKVPGF